MKNDIAIKLTNISKRYYLHAEKPTLIENLNPFKKTQEFWALKDIDLTIKKGEHIGVAGPNGSGKTTLLKIIAGISKPSTGSVETRGKIVSLIELSAGFNAELTGIENILSCGLFLGIEKKKLIKELPHIIKYADIGEFIYQPLYTYSSGMMLRLSSSLIFSVNPDILLIDEGFFYGDKKYRHAMYEQIHTGSLKKSTILIVSNHQNFLKKHSDRVITINNCTLK